MALHIAKRLLRTHSTTPTVALFSAVDRSFSSTSSDLIRASLFPCDGIGPEIAESVKQKYVPVQDVADSCTAGAATNVIFGLALGYKYVIIPIFAITISVFVSFSLAPMYGIAVAALGMPSTIATSLAIHAYGPMSDNAGGIAEMAGMSHRIRERTDALDVAGNTTAAIGKVMLAGLLRWLACIYTVTLGV
ncbi:putative inorganic diphosphatase [Helianthus debilis subsp. tardiflorus]